MRLSRRGLWTVVVVWVLGAGLLLADQFVWHGELACRTVQAQHEMPTNC